MVAATAVGVSHLVQSTRAGADYGLTMSLAIVLIVALKYPTFRFAAEYASATGRSLVHAYAAQGRVAIAWLVFAMLIEMFVGASAVALVAGGMLVRVAGVAADNAVAAIAIVMLTALILANGRYARSERLVKGLVIAFSALTVVATVVAIPKLGDSGRHVFGSLQMDLATLAFIVAMTGWMPLPVSVSAFHSVWIKEKRAQAGPGFDRSQVVFDLNVGWVLTLLLALCFVIMGAAVLFETATQLPGSASEFASLLFSVFTELSGDWVYPVLAVGGLAVIWSTLVAIMDAVPRLMDRLVVELRLRKDDSASLYRPFLAMQVGGVFIVLTFFLGDFARFVDFAASTGFVVAPGIAWFNYRAIRSPEVADGYRPSRMTIAWHFFAIACFIACAAIFFLMRFR